MILGATVLFAAILLVTDLLLARAQLQKGAAEANRALRLTTSRAALTVSSHHSAILSDLARAQMDFGRARADLLPLSPLLSHLGGVPVVGPSLASAAPAATAAYDSASSALDLFQGLQPVLRIAGKRRRGDGVQRLLLAVNASSAKFVSAERQAVAAESIVQSIPPRTGDRTLDRATARARTELPVLVSASRWLILTPSLLGVNSPAHYLFAWENPAELRATGGFIGASDYLTVHRGTVHGEFSGHVLPHEITTVPPPLPETMYTPEQYLLFSDSNWSPDFPLSARLERWFYGEDTGRWADGVIDFVDTGIPDILHGTGAVYLPGYRVWVTPANAAALAEQYINGVNNGPVRQGAPDTVRKQFFAAVLQALLHRVQTLPVSRLPALGAALYRAITRHEILFYDQRPDVESAIRSLGAAGSLQREGGDFLAIVDDNRSYNKINPYVHESASYAAAVRPDRSIDATLTIHYHLNASPADLEGGGPNWGLWGTKHDYQDFLRVYVPPGAHLIDERGADVWAPGPAYGLTQFAGRFILREGHSLTVSFRYILPPSTLNSNPANYVLSVHPQPGTTLTALNATVSGLRGVRLAAAGGQARQSITTRLSLVQDDAFHLALRNVQPSALPVVRALAGPASDPYLPYGYFRDPRHRL